MDLSSKYEEIKVIWEFSNKIKKEVTGSYICNEKLELYKEIYVGNLYNVDVLRIKENIHITFHTHLAKFSSPSGNDILCLVKQILDGHVIYSFVIDEEFIYTYSLETKFIDRLKELNLEEIIKWKEIFVKKIDILSINYSKNKDMVKYVSEMLKMDVIINIFAH